MSERTVLRKKPALINSLGALNVESVVLEDGGTAYCNPMVGDFDVYPYELGFLLAGWIKRIRSMAMLLYDPDHEEFCDNMFTLLDAFERNVEEAVCCVMNDIGIIKCHVANEETGPWLRGRVVGIEFEQTAHGDDGLQIIPKGGKS
jgi:hypothetical protein